MILVIDIGNTNVDIAGVSGEEIVLTGRAPTNREWGVDEYTEALGDCLRVASCRGAVLSSVVPQITGAVSQAVERLCGITPMLVTGETKTGLIVDVQHPEKVGRDRLVDAAWAAEKYPLPAVTADLGTASTFNLILPGKIFAGGIICAGIQTGLFALNQRAAQLPMPELRIPKSVIGKNTEDCMLSGAVSGTAAMIDGLVRDIEDEIGSPVTLLITGGGGKYASPFVRHEHVFDPDLTRKGLALLFELNKEHI